MKVVLFLVLVMYGQKPLQISLPQPDVKTCMAEADRFLKLEAPNGKRVTLKVASCAVGDQTPGQDVKE